MACMFGNSMWDRSFLSLCLFCLSSTAFACGVWIGMPALVLLT